MSFHEISDRSDSTAKRYRANAKKLDDVVANYEPDTLAIVKSSASDYQDYMAGMLLMVWWVAQGLSCTSEQH